MPCFVRQWMAREGHEGHLRHGLVAAHEAFVSKSSHMMEGLLYREHFAGREFLGVSFFDDPDAVESSERSSLLSTLDRLSVEHAERDSDSMRLETLFESTTIGQTTPHGLAAVLTAAPGKAVPLTGLLVGFACEINHRLAPSRILVGRAAYTPSRFLVLLSSPTRIDLDRYLRSPLGRDQLGALRPLLAAPPCWYALDPVWYYFRRLESSWRTQHAQAARDFREPVS